MDIHDRSDHQGYIPRWIRVGTDNTCWWLSVDQIEMRSIKSQLAPP